MDKELGIFWFRQDLRLNDNLALTELTIKCKNILPIYILDKNADIGSASKWWLHHSLLSLDKSLRKKKSQLYLFNAVPEKILVYLTNKYNIKNVYWNRLYDKYSINRDIIIKKKLKKLNIDVLTFNGSLINEPWNIKNKTNSFFKVFTPYWNKCIEEIDTIKLSKSPNVINTMPLNISNTVQLKELNLFKKDLKWTSIFNSYWTPGEESALKNFNYFKSKVIDNYDQGRDRPDKDYTSKLSPHLHFGEISPKRIFKEIYYENIVNNKSKKKYLAEIGWREFSYNLLFNYPKIRTDPIQEKFKRFPWKKNEKFLNLWKKGKTGYPIVDAGMRQLYLTGWMHNRVRMIVGSFLCKNLLIHWWEGEKWFFDTLVDADLGSNSAGWQWIAGCGADAAPYFRVFNPITQGLKFDPEGKYVKTYIPELKNLPSNIIHSPWELDKENQKKYNCLIGKDYPKPIVNLSESRDNALLAFSKIKKINQ